MFTPGAGVDGHTTLTLVLLDYAGDAGQSRLEISDLRFLISGGASVPLIVSPPPPVTEDQPFLGQFHAHDVDGDALTFSLVEGHGPAHGSASVNADGSFTYTPDANYSGSDSFDYQVDDGHGGTDTATYGFEVAAVNDAPVASDGSASGAEDSVISGQASANDVDGDSLTYSLAAPPPPPNVQAGPLQAVQHGALDFHSDGTFTYTPDHDFFGTDSFDYQVADGHGGVATGTITLTVDEQNVAPVPVQGSFATLEDTGLSGQVVASDADGDNLIFALATGPAHGTMTFQSDGHFHYTPDADYDSFSTRTIDGFTFTVSDGHGHTVDGAALVGVLPVNDTPTGEDGKVKTGEDAAISGQVTATDRDGPFALTYSLVGPAPAGFTFHADGTWTFDPTHIDAYQALDSKDDEIVSVDYRAFDGMAYSDPIRLSIQVNGVNEAVAGTTGKDNITGSAIGEDITALAGDDIIHAGGGRDGVWGGDGSDKIYGGEGHDRLFGEAGNDTVNGEAGNDTVSGGDGADTLDGGDDNDVVNGDAGADVVKGGAGDDLVYGDAGNDDVQGGTGDDWVCGGAGADRLSGGTGADHFVFMDGDLGSTLATSDTVTDFKASQGDVLDFSGIDANTMLGGDQGFSIVGSFGNHASEMTVTFNAGLNATVVSMDTNGDGVADYMLQLTGSVSPTAGWVL